MADAVIATDDPWAKFRKPPAGLQGAPAVAPDASPAPAAADPWAKFRKPPANGGRAIAQASGPGATIGAMVGAGAPIAPQEPVGVAEDMARAVPSGLVKGTQGLIAAPGLVGGLIDAGLKNAPRLIGRPAITDEEAAAQPHSPFDMSSPGTAASSINPNRALTAVNAGIDKVAAPIKYDPVTTPGKYTEAIAEAVPGAALGGGGIAVKALGAIGGGVGSQALGDQFKGTKYEGVARFVGAILGGTSAAASRIGGTAEQIFKEGLKGVDNGDLVKATALLKDAYDKGVKLSIPEAVAQVQGAPNRLNEIQRMVEQSRGGSPVMKEFYRDRPAEVQAAGGKALEDVAPQTLDPVRTGTRGQAAAQGAIDDTRKQINDASRPFYAQAEAQQIPDAAFEGISKNPVFQAGLKDLRSDPILGPKFKDAPDNSVAVVDEVTKRTQDMASAASTRGENYRASVIGSGTSDARDAARAASPDYSAALDMQAAGRRDFLAPMEEGPLGKVAATTDSGKQAAALFPEVPRSGSAPVVGDAVKAMVKRDPEAAVNVVGEHIRTAFAEATQKNMGGPNAWGGAKFAAELMGNPEQAKVLEEAVRALPHGNSRWDGFKRFTEIMEATGKRLPANSSTEANRQITEQMGKGGAFKSVGTAVLSGGFNPLKYARDALTYFRTGHNAEQLAKLFTDKSATGLLARIAREPVGSPRGAAFALRLGLIAAPELKSVMQSVK